MKMLERIRAVRPGPVVVGATAGIIMAGVILAVAAAVVPQVQDYAAQESLRAFQGANAAAHADGVAFQDTVGLIGRGYLPAGAGAVRSTHGDNCYVATATSATGTVFYATSRGPGVSPVTASTVTTRCAPMSPVDVVGLPWVKAKPILRAAGFALDYDRRADGALASALAVVKSTAYTGSTVTVKFTG